MDFSAVSRILEDYRGRGYYPSAVCQIFDEARTLYHRAFGDVTPDTWFDLASVSKIICTTLLLSAMDEGRLSLRIGSWSSSRRSVPAPSPGSAWSG